MIGARILLILSVLLTLLGGILDEAPIILAAFGSYLLSDALAENAKLRHFIRRSRRRSA